jgi:hypothetical protein
MGETNKQQSPQDSGMIVEKDEKGRFVKGHKKIGGKQIGSRSFNTIFEEAIKEIAASKELKIDNPEQKLMVKAVIEALKGNHNFWKSLAEFRYGKPKESIDLTTGGESFKSTPEEREAINKVFKLDEK